MPKTNYFRNGLISAILSGLLLSLAFPFWACEFSQIGKTGIGILAWVALVPFMLFLLNARRIYQALLTGLLTGIIFHFLLIYWLMGTMHNYGYMSWGLSAALLLCIAIVTSILFWIILTFFMRLCTGSPWVFFLGSACVWVGVEFFRTYAFTGLPWALLGYSQYQYLTLIQIVDITGVYGVSFMLVLGNAALALVFNAFNQPITHRAGYLSQALICLVLAALVTVGVGVYGKERQTEIEHKIAAAGKVNIGLVQAAIPQDKKWEPAFQNETMQLYAKYTFETAALNPDLIIWAETALPFFFPQDAEWTRKIYSLVNHVNRPFYVGAQRYEQEGFNENTVTSYYNSGCLLVPQMGITDIYNKVHLVPFGEYVPWRNVLFFMGKITDTVGDGFSPGVAGQVVTLRLEHDKSIELGTLICYEGIFADLARGMARNGANLLVNITNDAWYDYSAGPYQHFIISMFRGIETRISFVRCANTGISAYVLPTGQIIYQTQLFEILGTSREVPLMTETTFYTKHGNVFAISISVLAVVLAVGNGFTSVTAENMMKSV